jgi:hypothetical protein
MSKPRSDSILLNLPEEQQAKLADWLLGGVPYHEAKPLVEEEFGVSFKSLKPFEAFWKQVCAPLLLQRRRRMLPLAEARAKEALENPGQFDVATLDALKQKAYELAESPTATLKDVKAVLGLLLKARSEDRADRELTFEREKFEFDAAKSCLRALPDLKAISTSKTLSEPQKVEQIRLRLFGKIPAAQS